MADVSSADIKAGGLAEVDNALNQARRSPRAIGRHADINRTPLRTLPLVTDDEMKMNAVCAIVQTRLARRGVPVKNFKNEDSEAAGGGKVRRLITIQQGLPIEASREIVKFLKDLKLKKVQASIQADQVRVSAPSKDDLQQAMGHLRGHDFGVSLHFGNYR